MSDDALTTFGIINTFIALLFCRYRSASSFTCMVPFLKGGSNHSDSSVFPLVLEYADEWSLREMLHNSIDIMEQCYSHSGLELKKLVSQQFAGTTGRLSNILIQGNGIHIPVDNNEDFDIIITVDTDNYTLRFQYDPKCISRIPFHAIARAPGAGREGVWQCQLTPFRNRDYN